MLKEMTILREFGIRSCAVGAERKIDKNKFYIFLFNEVLGSFAPSTFGGLPQ